MVHKGAMDKVHKADHAGQFISKVGHDQLDNEPVQQFTRGHEASTARAAWVAWVAHVRYMRNVTTQP